MREYSSPERPTFGLRAVPSSAAHAFHPARIELLFTMQSPQHTSHVPWSSLMRVHTSTSSSPNHVRSHCKLPSIGLMIMI